MPTTIGVVLAGGTGSRLAPLTRVLNKHLLPVNGQPMLHWPIRTLALAGIERIVVVLGGKSAGEVVEHFGSEYVVDGRTLRLAYVYQREPGGIGQALGVALPLVEEIGADRVRVILGDNVFPDPVQFAPIAAPGCALVVGIEGLDHPERSYGCVEIVRGRAQPMLPVEKPNCPPPFGGRWVALSGLYDLPVDSPTHGRLLTLVDAIKPSARGEVEVVSILAAFHSAGALAVAIMSGAGWIDAGEHEGYRKANDPSFWPRPVTGPE